MMKKPMEEVTKGNFERPVECDFCWTLFQALYSKYAFLSIYILNKYINGLLDWFYNSFTFCEETGNEEMNSIGH